MTAPTKTYRIPSLDCPNCRRKLDAVSDVLGHQHIPKEGDYTFCIDCDAVLRFAPGMTLEAVTDPKTIPLDILLELVKVMAANRVLRPIFKAQNN